MCAIAGCYQRAGAAALVAAMSERMAHRGPDSDGLYHFAHGDVQVCLAHRRLAIIDLSEGGAQPFTKDGLTIVYNGEILNYRQLRSELAAVGVAFRSSCDTEVVLEAWRRWGAAALDRFRGMFAFGLFDQRNGHLVLARDQLGLKPLFLRRHNGGVVFASELKALVAVVGPELEIDPGALVASLLYYWVPDQRCALRGVEKLPPGVWAEFCPDGQSSYHQYWSLPDFAAAAAAGPPAELGPVIEQSVTAHLVADVAVAAFLSGGLDSSIVAVLAKRAIPDLNAYTITFRPQDRRLEAMPDDATYARIVAARFGIELHEIEIAPDIAQLLPRMVDTLDEPIGDPAAINTFLICQAARQGGVKVLLSGSGADELFGGYRKYRACLLAARYRRLPGSLRNGVVGPLVDRLPLVVAGRGLRHSRWAKRFLSFAEMPEEPAFRRSYTLYGHDELVDLLDPSLAPHVAKVLAEHAAIYNDTTLDDHVNRMCLADTRLILPGLNLAYTDRAAMAASTEVRVPFVDVEVLRAAFSLPGSAKVRGRHSKIALKEAAQPWLPPKIRNRPKALFSAPLRAWISRDLREMVDEVVLGGELVRSGFLRRPAVQRLVEQDRAGHDDHAKQIWHLLTLELWYKQMTARGVRA